MLADPALLPPPRNGTLDAWIRLRKGDDGTELIANEDTQATRHAAAAKRGASLVMVERERKEMCVSSASIFVSFRRKAEFNVNPNTDTNRPSHSNNTNDTHIRKIMTASAASGSTGGLPDAEDAKADNERRVDEITALQDGVGEVSSSSKADGSFRLIFSLLGVRYHPHLSVILPFRRFAW